MRLNPLAIRILMAFLSFTILIALQYVGWRAGGAFQVRWTAWRMEKAAVEKCLSFSPAPGQVVFDEEIPRRSVELRYYKTHASDPPVYRTGRFASVTTQPVQEGDNWFGFHSGDCFGEIWTARMMVPGTHRVKCGSGLRELRYSPIVDGDRSATIYGDYESVRSRLFFHGLQTSSGTRRLVTLNFDPPAFIWNQPRPFNVAVWDIRGDGRLGEELYNAPIACTGTWPPPEPMRLMAGRANAEPTCQFTIPYTFGARNGQIEGYLRDDNTVILIAREMPQ